MAATKILMPKMGYDMEQGTIVRWLKHEGDRVQKGDPIAEIETEKVNIDIEAFASGVMLKIIAQEGDTIPVGQQIALIGEPEEQAEKATPGQELPRQEQGAGEGAESQATQVQVEPATAKQEAQPAADAKLAAEQQPKPEQEQRQQPTAEQKAETSTPQGSPEPASASGRPPIHEEGTGEGSESQPTGTEAQEPAPERRPIAGPEATVAEGEDGERIKASPVARRIAGEQKVPLGQVQGTGPGGRITKEDVEAFLTAAAQRQREGGQPAPVQRAPEPATAPAARATEQPAAQPEAAPAAGPEEVPFETRDLSRMGQAIARLMAESKKSIPHFYATVEVDMSAVASLREDLNRTAPEERKISLNDFVIKAAAVALTKHPLMNSAWAEGKLKLFQQVNIGVAVALEQGLVVPVIHDCDKKSLGQIAKDSREVIAHAREGRMRQEEYQGATFTISNMGMLGVDEFSAIISPGQSAILAVGTIAPRPVVRDNSLAIARTMKSTLSVDHRVGNGADGARYLAEFRQLLENPRALLG